MRFVAALAAVVLLASGCGGDDDEPAAAPTPSTAPSSTSSAAPSREPAASYVGTTPCDAITRPVPLMKPGAECELATWRLELGVDGRYELAAAYGMSEPNTTGIRDGGTTVELAGTYAAENGVISLRTDVPGVTVRFLRVGVGILYLLDADNRLVPGTAAWSYTLNSAGKAGRTTPLVTPVFAEPGGPGGGVFEGRTPCTPDVRRFTPDLLGDCSKVKWRLTLRQNAAGKPAGYVSGVEGRASSRQGAWRIVRGLPGHPDAVVYELSSNGGRQSLTLLLVGAGHLFMLGPDDDLLVGDELWSYTLSRSE